MSDWPSRPCTAFDHHRRLASGPLGEVALAVKAALASGPPRSILVFGDVTGRVIDLDLRGTDAEILARLSARAPISPDEGGADRRAAGPVTPSNGAATAEGGAATVEGGDARGRGRPKLGVVAREVTLLPRHWDWLGAQPGGASAALRRLVDEARRQDGGRQRRRAAQEAAYHFMQAIAGNLPGYEEATRALFADDRPRFERWTAQWPPDIRAYASRLAFGSAEPDGAP